MRQIAVVSIRYYGTFYAEITVASTHEVYRQHTAGHIRYPEHALTSGYPIMGKSLMTKAVIGRHMIAFQKKPRWLWTGIVRWI